MIHVRARAPNGCTVAQPNTCRACSKTEMENRRPPRSNSSGRRPYFDRDRGAPSFRGGKPSGPGSGKGPRRSHRTDDGRPPDGSGRGSDPRRKDGRGGGEYRRADGKRFGHGRFDQKSGGYKSRGRNGKHPKPETEIKLTSDAQITDGKLRGKTLLNSDSPNTIPTKRKLREIAFKVISRRVKAARILDLGAGSGTIGIEAISRGAMLATFVERSARMCSFIRKNLDGMGVKNGHGEIVEMEIIPFLKRSVRRKRAWDIVYLDLPDGDEHAAILDHLSRGAAIRTGGLLLLEHHVTTSYPDNITKLKRWRTIDQGETILSIYERI